MQTYEAILVRNQTGKVLIEANNEEHAAQLISDGQYTEPEWNDTDFYFDSIAKHKPS